MATERRVRLFPIAGLQFRVNDFGRIEQFRKHKEYLLQPRSHRRFVVVGLLESERRAGQGHRPPRFLGASAGPSKRGVMPLKAASNRKADSGGEGSPMLAQTP